MLIYRLLPFIIIGGGFLICKAIFKAYPLQLEFLNEKDNKLTVISMWSLAFLIICGQLIYIWKLINIFLIISDPLKYPILVFFLIIIIMYSIFIFIKR
jgi:hypothetical protein